MIPVSKFQLKTETHAGIDSRKSIPDILKREQYQNILMLVDDGVREQKVVLELAETLKSQNFNLTVDYTRSGEEPDYDYLDAKAELHRKKIPDAIISIGGGSNMDLAKAIAILLTNSGKGLEYRGFDMVQNQGVPVMCIPTTAGTGSEITINAVFTNKAENKKLGINGRYLSATIAILDPEFTINAPEAVAVSAGIDAMVHTLESFVTGNATIMTRFYACEAFRLLFHNLPCLIDDPSNLEKRLSLQLGAYYAAISLFNSGSGIAGGISYPLGTYYKVPHGIGGGMFAVPVVEYNVNHGYNDYTVLYDLIECVDKSQSNEQKSVDFVIKLKDLVMQLNVPRSLKQWGIGTQQYDHVIEIMQILQGAFDQNPIKLPVEKVGILLDPFFEKVS